MEKIKEFLYYFVGQKIVKDIVGKKRNIKNSSSFHSFFLYRCPDCVVAEKPVEESVKSSLPSDGVFIECSVGDRP